MRSSSSGENRCVTTLITAAKETKIQPIEPFAEQVMYIAAQRYISFSFLQLTAYRGVSYYAILVSE